MNQPAAAQTEARPARPSPPTTGVPARSRPSAARAAAAARLVGAAGATAPVGAWVAPLAPEEPGEPARHLRVVPTPNRSPAQRRRRARAMLLAVAGVTAMVAFGLVYLHVVLAQRQFALDRLTAQVQAESTTYQDLRLQVAQLRSPAHIISTAEGRLGMIQPASVTYLTPTTTITGARSAAIGSSATSGSSAQAPAGDADWPQIKSQLAGSP
jgi:cell division protein FtsL